MIVNMDERRNKLLKEENILLEKKNKHLKDLIGAKGKLIPKELRKIVVELELKKPVLQELELSISEAGNKISTLEIQRVEIQKGYDKEKHTFDARMELMAKKEKNKLKEIEAKSKKQTKTQTKEVMSAQEKIEKIQRQIISLNNNIQSLNQEFMANKKTNKELTSKNKSLNHDNSRAKEDAELLGNKKKVIEDSIASLEISRDAIRKETDKAESRLEDIIKKRDLAIKKTAQINKKEDHLRMFEEYIKTNSQRMGLGYRPFK